MSDSFRDEICFCGCHYNPGIMHIAPCCYQCKKCGIRILIHAYTKHVRECKGLFLCSVEESA